MGPMRWSDGLCCFELDECEVGSGFGLMGPMRWSDGLCCFELHECDVGSGFGLAEAMPAVATLLPRSMAATPTVTINLRISWVLPSNRPFPGCWCREGI